VEAVSVTTLAGQSGGCEGGRLYAPHIRHVRRSKLEAMKRFFHLGLWCFGLLVVFAPLAECFDRWDPPGIVDDTEFAIFASLLMLGLVILVSRMISMFALRVSLVLVALMERPAKMHARDLWLIDCQAVSPFPLSPLRI